jgi:hypothetical protein
MRVLQHFLLAKRRADQPGALKQIQELDPSEKPERAKER